MTKRIEEIFSLFPSWWRVECMGFTLMCPAKDNNIYADPSSKVQRRLEPVLYCINQTAINLYSKLEIFKIVIAVSLNTLPWMLLCLSCFMSWVNVSSYNNQPTKKNRSAPIQNLLNARYNRYFLTYLVPYLMSRLSIGVIQVYLVHKERRKFGCLRQPVNKFLIFDNKTAELESGDRKLCNTFHTFNTSYRKHEKKKCYESFWYLIGILNGNGFRCSWILSSQIFNFLTYISVNKWGKH